MEAPSESEAEMTEVAEMVVNTGYKLEYNVMRCNNDGGVRGGDGQSIQHMKDSGGSVQRNIQHR